MLLKVILFCLTLLTALLHAAHVFHPANDIPMEHRLYVVNERSHTISVINTENNTVVGNPIPVGEHPRSLTLSQDGSHLYVVNSGSNTVSVIDTETRPVVGIIAVGEAPISAVFGKNIHTLEKQNPTKVLGEGG